jgi:hypothetical protein
MKTYEANYIDQNGKIVSETTIEAQNLKEANKIAQIHKRNTLEIQNAGRVKTFVGLRAHVMKELKNLIQEIDELQEQDKNMKKNGQMSDEDRKRLSPFFE